MSVLRLFKVIIIIFVIVGNYGHLSFKERDLSASV